MASATVESSPSRPRLMTSEQFLDWLEPGVHADLIDGEIVMHSPVNLLHSQLINFVDHLLRSYIEHEELGQLYRETFAVRLSVRETFLPDLAFFTRAQVPRLLETHAPIAPVFVCEALSSTTAHNDTGRKFAAYEQHGVQEYWILDPERLDHHFFRREGDLLVEFAAKAERIEAGSIKGFWLERAWLNPRRLPRVSECLAAILRKRRPKTTRRR